MELHKKHNSGQATFLKIFGSLTSRIVSFVREIIVAALFGTTYISDVIQLIEGIFVAIFGSVGNSIIIPFMSSYSEKETKKEATALFLQQVFTIYFFLGLFFTTIICLFPSVFLKLAAAGFKGQTLAYAVYSTRIMSTMIFSFVLIVFFKGLFFIQKDFLLSSFYETFISLTTIGLLYLNKNSEFLPINKASSYLVPVIILWTYFYIKERKFLKLTFYKIKDAIKELWLPSRPLLLSSIFFFFGTIIDKSLASSIGPGAVSAQGYAMRIYNLPITIWATQIAEVSLPFLVEYFQINLQTAKIFVEENLEKIIFITLPASVGLYVLASPIVKIIYERGAFTPADTLLVGKTLASYSLFVLFFSFNIFLTNMFYARKFTKISLLYVFLLPVSISLKWFLAFKLNLGVVGLGLAAGIIEVISTIYLFSYYSYKYKEPCRIKFIFDFLKIAAASSLMGLVATFLNKNNYGLLSAILFSAFSYGMTLLILKENVALKYFAKILEKIKNGKNQ
jgi:putative peptidoglycan lipid II flippase